MHSKYNHKVVRPMNRMHYHVKIHMPAYVQKAFSTSISSKGESKKAQMWMRGQIQHLVVFIFTKLTEVWLDGVRSHSGDWSVWLNGVRSHSGDWSVWLDGVRSHSGDWSVWLDGVRSHSGDWSVWLDGVRSHSGDWSVYNHYLADTHTFRVILTSCHTMQIFDVMNYFLMS